MQEVDIRKVVKAYFAFMMVMVTAASLTYTDFVHGYLVSVIHTVDQIGSKNLDSKDLDHKNFQANIFQIEQPAATKEVENQAEELFNFELKKTFSSGKHFAQAGEKDTVISNISLYAKDKDLNLKSFRLRLEGIASANLENVRLMEGETLLDSAKIEPGFLFFEGINLEVGIGESRELAIKADLGENLQSGQRFHLALESAEDLKIFAGSTKLNIGGFFPQTAGAISIVKKRPESLQWEGQSLEIVGKLELAL